MPAKGEAKETKAKAEGKGKDLMITEDEIDSIIKAASKDGKSVDVDELTKAVDTKFESKAEKVDGKLGKGEKTDEGDETVSKEVDASVEDILAKLPMDGKESKAKESKEAKGKEAKGKGKLDDATKILVAKEVAKDMGKVGKESKEEKKDGKAKSPEKAKQTDDEIAAILSGVLAKDGKDGKAKEGKEGKSKEGKDGKNGKDGKGKGKDSKGKGDDDDDDDDDSLTQVEEVEGESEAEDA